MSRVAFYTRNQAEDLHLQVIEEGTVKLKQLQILGKPGISSGLAIFQSAATSAEPSAPQQVLGCCSCFDAFHLIDNCHMYSCRSSCAYAAAYSSWPKPVLHTHVLTQTRIYKCLTTCMQGAAIKEQVMLGVCIKGCTRLTYPSLVCSATGNQYRQHCSTTQTQCCYRWQAQHRKVFMPACCCACICRVYQLSSSA